MRTLITALMASTVSLLTFSAVQAADAVDEVPAAPAAEYSEPVSGNWAGAYAGVTAGYQKGKFDATGGTKADGFGGGVYGGYNMQNGQIVYGAEADLGYSGIDAQDGARAMEQGVNGSVRGRLGVDLNPVLVYGTAGIAGSNVKALDATSTDKHTLVGWTAGVGAEAMVTDNVTARVEYRYTDYNSKNFALNSGNVRSDLEDNSVRVGVGMKF
ncbi:outer membrane protein [Pararhizobium sp.]|uniref:outer membrane protein n=1 Tax=Pararhizobium sp. TaxID=1977563 RepID=UPI00271E82F2|nr:outer membrane protein [Pararhizobium sp.]MDO9417593.1 porin family protein [Pararhizobium sp.]